MLFIHCTDEADDDAQWNDGNVRSVCECVHVEDEGTDCEDRESVTDW